MTTARVEFRVGVRDDAGAIAALVNSAYRGESSRAGWTTEADLLGGQRTDAEGIAAVIDAVDSRIVVAEDFGALHGCVRLDFQRHKNHAHLGMLTVAPTLQNTGLGRRLLAHAEEFARATWHAGAIEMTVISIRAELIAWYERRGYARTGEARPFPAHDPRFGLPKRALEFVVLQKTL